ncbi:hypothetical protein EVAR_63075_1 [Eumeta japonica]|uniref:Uncharacterized protein n=1 Tax=Eumeta variegata TaxID=151549 RepID=A0A4C1ZWY2_EUMVA|nr:hypothetical protein EVAR_63075_1 [Eumeta japonica]
MNEVPSGDNIVVVLTSQRTTPTHCGGVVENRRLRAAAARRPAWAARAARTGPRRRRCVTGARNENKHSLMTIGSRCSDHRPPSVVFSRVFMRRPQTKGRCRPRRGRLQIFLRTPRVLHVDRIYRRRMLNIAAFPFHWSGPDEGVRAP